MTEIQLLVDFHSDAKRQGPGSDTDTIQALELLHLSLDKKLKILDIGCGTGAQTMVLAKRLNAEIVAVDLFPEFLSQLNTQAQELGLEKKITTLEESMENLSFESGCFDLIWSEGAIYNIGFEEGIKNWQKFLKIGGYIALSEITYTTNQRPKELEEHWQNEYPQIDTASKKIQILEENGFSPVGYFYLPESSWMENYYLPIEDRLNTFLEKHNHSKMAKEIVEQVRNEIALYRKYKSYYSYGFYLAKKVN